jgi:hypothetical protein
MLAYSAHSVNSVRKELSQIYGAYAFFWPTLPVSSLKNLIYCEGFISTSVADLVLFCVTYHKPNVPAKIRHAHTPHGPPT